MMRGLVSVVTGPPTPQFVSEEPLHCEGERNGATVVDTATDCVTAALLFSRLKTWISGSRTHFSRKRKVRLKLMSSWLSRGVRNAPGDTNCKVSVIGVPGSIKAFKAGLVPSCGQAAQSAGYLVVELTERVR